MYAIYGGKISLLTLLGQSLLGKSGRDAGESCEHTGQEQIGGTLYLFRRNLVVEPCHCTEIMDDLVRRREQLRKEKKQIDIGSKPRIKGRKVAVSR